MATLAAATVFPQLKRTTMIVYTQDGRSRIRLAQPATGAKKTLTELDVTDPEESDVDFVVHAFDSALPYLASIGSEAQWGTKPFSEKPQVVQSFAKYVQESYDLYHGSIHDATPWQHMSLYEVKTPNNKWIRVSAQGLSTSFPVYVPESLADNKTRTASDYLYLNYLIADRRKGDLAKGSAAHLVKFADQRAKELNKKIVYGDCWRGNKNGLLR